MGLIIAVILLGLVSNTWDISPWLTGLGWMVLTVVATLSGRLLMIQIVQGQGHWFQGLIAFVGLNLGAAWLGHWLLGLMM